MVDSSNNVPSLNDILDYIMDPNPSKRNKTSEKKDPLIEKNDKSSLLDDIVDNIMIPISSINQKNISERNDHLNKKKHSSLHDNNEKNAISTINQPEKCRRIEKNNKHSSLHVNNEKNVMSTVNQPEKCRRIEKNNTLSSSHCDRKIHISTKHIDKSNHNPQIKSPHTFRSIDDILNDIMVPSSLQNHSIKKDIVIEKKELSSLDSVVDNIMVAHDCEITTCFLLSDLII